MLIKIKVLLEGFLMYKTRIIPLVVLIVGWFVFKTLWMAWGLP